MINKKYFEISRKWDALIDSPKFKISSNIIDYTECDEFSQIVEMGNVILPLLIDELKNGKYWYWHVVREVTHIDFKENNSESEQDIAKKYIDWWNAR